MKRKTNNVCFRLDRQVRAKLDHLAKQKQTTPSKLIKEGISHVINTQKPKYHA